MRTDQAPSSKRIVHTLFTLIQNQAAWRVGIIVGFVAVLVVLYGGIPIINAQGAGVIYVDADAMGTPDGLTWTTAYTTVQEALDAATPGDEIWVAEGIYYPDEGAGQTDDALESTFQLLDDVALYGGFAATETVRTERNWASNVTVLSGDIDHETNPDTTNGDNVVIDPANISGNNAYHVVTGSGVSSTAVLDGFAVTAGNANTLAVGDGGGMYNYAGSPTLTNVTFSGNFADGNGGAMYNDGSSPTITNATFSDNTSEGDGGGMANDNNSNPTLTNVTFSDNLADFGGGGGGMHNDFSNPTLIDVTFSGNEADDGGGLGNLTARSPTLISVTFRNNEARSDGGALSNFSSSPTIIDATFSDNDAGNFGGAIENTLTSSPTITNATFTGNEAERYGGAIYNSQSNPTLTNVTFGGNYAESSRGGGIYNFRSDPTLINATFSGNRADIAGIAGGGGIYNDDSNPTIQNSIFWNNQDQSGTGTADASIVDANGSATTISHSLVQGWNPVGAGNLDGTDVTNDPLLVTPVNPAVAPTTAGDLRLQLGSPAIDAGDDDVIPSGVTTDLAGNPRFSDGTSDGVPTVDMGAYEFSIDCTGVSSPLFVDHDATSGAGDGSSWSNAFLNVQDALVMAGACNLEEIWIAEGVYYPDEGTGQPNDARDSTFQLLDGVALYGGFAGTETTRAQRDADANVTVLTGDVDHETTPDTTDATGVVTDTANISGSNAYHVVTASGTDSSAVLDGVTVTAGLATGGAGDDLGGGMVNDGGSPTLTNVIFIGNGAAAGGGMANDSGSPTLTNVTFSANVAIGGGGMINGNGSSPTLTGVTFRGNKAADVAGGMANGNNSNPTLTNVTFSGNSSANIAGGMFNVNSSPALTNVVFSGNRADTYGGGMANGNSSPTLTNVIFSGNSATDGGGLVNVGSSPTIQNSIFWNNQDDDVTVTPSDSISNTIGSTPVIRYSLVQGSNGSGGSWATVVGTDGGGNIDANPRFVTPIDPNDAPTTAGDLRLSAHSPAIDAGDNSVITATTDLAGNPRIVNGTVDMGAYEFLFTEVGITKTVTPTTARPGEAITYTLSFTNSGLGIATGVVITDVVPVTVTTPSVTSGGAAITDTGATPAYVWQVQDLAPGAGGVITLTGTVSDSLSADGMLTNTATITAGTDITTTNNSASAATDVAVPRVQFDRAANSVGEAAGPAVVTVTLDAPNSHADVTVDLAISDGSATAGDDYTALNEVATIPAGATRVTTTVPITDDAIDEGDETMQLDLHNPGSAALATPVTATLTILDDDTAGVMVSPTSGLTTTEAGSTDTFSVTLQSRPTGPVTVTLASDDTGEGTVSPSVLVFDAGTWDTPQTATVAGVDDAVDDGDVGYSIQTSVASDDPTYDGMTAADVPVINQDDDPYRAYLPLVLAQPPAGLPDLVVRDLIVADDGVTVVIANEGEGPVVDPFWVDAYIDPEPAPTGVNQTWPMLAQEGLVWGVTQSALPLESGETLTLTVGDAYYDASESAFSGTLAAGTPVYAQVDSADAGSDYGAVLETHEDASGAYNNVTGPVTPAGAATVTGTTPAADGEARGAGLPARP